MTERKFKSRSVRWLFVGLAAVGVLHFAGSVFAWSLVQYVAVTKHNPHSGVDWSYFVYHASSAFILFAAFVLAFILACRFRALAAPVTLVSILAAFLCFSYDARHHNYQIQELGFDDTGCTHVYCTWWWYDDIHDPYR